MSRWEGAKAEKGRTRWATIVREAVKQSHPGLGARGRRGRVHRGSSRAVRRVSGCCVLEPTATTPLTAVIRPDGRDLVLVVGPEGGIAPEGARRDSRPPAPNGYDSGTRCCAPRRPVRRRSRCSARRSGGGERRVATMPRHDRIRREPTVFTRIPRARSPPRSSPRPRTGHRLPRHRAEGSRAPPRDRRRSSAHRNVVELAAGDPALLAELVAAGERASPTSTPTATSGSSSTPAPGAGQTVFHVHAHVLAGGLDGGIALGG